MRLRLSILPLAGALAPGAFGLTLIDDHFKQADYNAGPLAPQNGYATSGTGANFRYSALLRAVTLNTKNSQGKDYAFQSLNFDATSTSLLYASVDVASLGFVNTPESTTSRFGLAINGANGEIASLAFRFSGGSTTQAAVTGSVNGAGSLTIDDDGAIGSVRNLAILLDLDTHYAAFVVDNVLLGIHHYATDDSTISSVSLYANATGTDTGAWDNLDVETASPVPEPATLAALGLGALGLLRRRR